MENIKIKISRFLKKYVNSRNMPPWFLCRYTQCPLYKYNCLSLFLLLSMTDSTQPVTTYKSWKSCRHCSQRKLWPWLTTSPGRFTKGPDLLFIRLSWPLCNHLSHCCLFVLAFYHYHLFQTISTLLTILDTNTTINVYLLSEYQICILNQAATN